MKTLASLVDRLIQIFRRPAADIHDPVARTRDAYLAYLEAKRAWLLDLEIRTLRNRPELEFTVRNRFRLQLLYDKRTALRLEYLLRRDPRGFESVKSLSEISQQVEKNWNDIDNAVACTNDQIYQDIEE